jgi:hypothetical protein
VHLSLYAQTTDDHGYTLDESDSAEEQREQIEEQAFEESGLPEYEGEDKTDPPVIIGGGDNDCNIGIRQLVV